MRGMNRLKKRNIVDMRVMVTDEITPSYNSLWQKMDIIMVNDILKSNTSSLPHG